MKKIAAIAFIFLLSAQCIFKLGIITYFQANRDYIAEVLCINKEKPMTVCYGHCFLKRNISLADDETPKAPVSKLQVETSIFITNDFDIDLTTLHFSGIEKNSPPPSWYRLFRQNSFFHPPC